MVETIPEITKFVATMRHPPQRTTPDNLRYPYGTRGWNDGAAIRYWGLEPNEYVTLADVWPLNPEGELMALIMIETPEMVHMIRDVLSVPGLSGVLVGQGDLSLRLGVGTPASNPFHPEVEALVAQVAEACVNMGKLCGLVPEPSRGGMSGSGLWSGVSGQAGIQDLHLGTWKLHRTVIVRNFFEEEIRLQRLGDDLDLILDLIERATTLPATRRNPGAVADGLEGRGAQGLCQSGP